MGFLKNCPNCRSELVHLKRNPRGKFKCECMGDCWTQTKWFWTEHEAVYAWNKLTKEPKEET